MPSVILITFLWITISVTNFPYSSKKKKNYEFSQIDNEDMF